jgi:hypothetical protein
MAAADRDIGLHFFHAGKFDDTGGAELAFVGSVRQFARDLGVMDLQERHRAGIAEARMSAMPISSGASKSSIRTCSAFWSLVEWRMRTRAS